MRVLLIHEHYQRRGGEDEVFETEGALLEAAGHEVSRYSVHNDRVGELSSLQLAAATLWNRETLSQVGQLCAELRPDIIHIHNTFPLLSPAAHHAARASGAAVVQTLHNYRLYCPAATFFREGQVCEACGPRHVPWPAILHACYRDSRVASAATASMLTLHRLLRTWLRKVDVYIALSEFAKHKFVEYGLPSAKIRTKPNALFPDPGVQEEKGEYGVFVGRLSREKGVATLLAALRELAGRVPFQIVGGGPLEAEVARAAREIPNLRWAGEVSQARVLQLIGGARFTVVPSQWYEGFPRVVIESLARGTPVVAAQIGSLAEIATPGRVGLQFRPGDALDLARQIVWMDDRRAALREMAKGARTEFESKYSAEANLRLLEGIYSAAVALRQAPLFEPESAAP